MTQAFLPLLTRSGGSHRQQRVDDGPRPLPLTPAYAISKAAAFNMTQSLRALLAGRGVSVHAVLTGPTDTDMTRGFDIPKASRRVGRAGHLRRSGATGRRTSSPIRCRSPLAESWRSGVAKALEREYAAFVAGPAAASQHGRSWARQRGVPPGMRHSKGGKTR